jgi:hypothetical protein
MTDTHHPAEPVVADEWPPPWYWFAWAVAGASTWLLLDTGNRSDGSLGFWLFSLVTSAGLALVGCIAAMFQKLRLIGAALLAAGLGGVFFAVFMFF